MNTLWFTIIVLPAMTCEAHLFRNLMVGSAANEIWWASQLWFCLWRYRNRRQYERSAGGPHDRIQIWERRPALHLMF